MDMYTLERREGVVIIRLEPSRIDVKTTRQLGESLATIEGEFDRYILDLSNVMHMDSSAVGTLVAYKQKITQKNKKLVLCNLSPFLREIFNILRMDSVFVIAVDLDGALRA